MNKLSTITILLTLLMLPISQTLGQTNIKPQEFEKIELWIPEGKYIRKKDVRVVFDQGTMRINSLRDGKTLKEWKRGEISAAEYSYTNNPRWKTGLRLSAASLLFPPLLFVTIPIGFTKYRRHWITIRTENDYAVLKISKRSRKLFIPAFETCSGVKIEAVGDNK